MKEPPSQIIEAARQAALRSPCAKSKRGVVLFNPMLLPNPAAISPLRGSVADAIATLGYNGPPPGFTCKNTMVCRGNCAEICVHAEQRAIMDALRFSVSSIEGLELVHIKAVAGPEPGGGGIVATGPPSCLQCSRIIADVNLRAVWLWESTDIVGRTDQTTGTETCTCGERGTAIAERSFGDPPRLVVHRLPSCPAMGANAEWRRYSAEDFHRATLATNDLRSLA